MFRNRNPPSAANAHTAITLAPENGALAKKRTSIRGSFTPQLVADEGDEARASATVNSAMISPESQPRW